MTKVTKISDKLNQVNDNFNVYMYDNGFMLEIGGRGHDDNWKTSKITVQTIDELVELIKEATQLERE